MKMEKVIVNVDDITYGPASLLRIKINLFLDSLSEWADTPESLLCAYCPNAIVDDMECNVAILWVSSNRAGSIVFTVLVN
jgi:hypothetical protein